MDDPDIQPASKLQNMLIKLNSSKNAKFKKIEHSRNNQSKNKEGSPIKINSSEINNLENYGLPSKNSNLVKSLYNLNKTQKTINTTRNKIGTYSSNANSILHTKEDKKESINIASTALSYMKNSFASSKESKKEESPKKNLSLNYSLKKILNSSRTSSNVNIETHVNYPKFVSSNNKINKQEDTTCNDDIIKLIGKKVNNLKIKLIQEDIKFRIDKNKFSKHIVKILEFVGNDCCGIYNSNKSLRTAMLQYLKNKSDYIIQKFRRLYNKYFYVFKCKLIVNSQNSKFLSNYFRTYSRFNNKSSNYNTRRIFWKYSYNNRTLKVQRR